MKKPQKSSSAKSKAKTSGKVQTAGKSSPRSNSAKSRTNSAKETTAALAKTTKTEQCLALLTVPQGATIEELQAATGWQAHSVRGFLAGTVKKKLGLTLDSRKAEDGIRRYFIVKAEA